MLRFPATVPGQDATAFLDLHWQKAPLWLPSAADPGTLPGIEPDELAWLATLQDVESRLVTTEIRAERSFYRVETGPFGARRLESLPTHNWTLLIQDAEKHLPELRRYFDLVPFVPDWRIDDLMISVAAPGGSVGPHVDNYDVFLVQTSGHRQWHWTTETVATDRQASDQLRLVKPLPGATSQVAKPGDILYLNPGVAHHGIAGDLCVTCSIGMRAPQVSELSGRALDSEDGFYSDPDLGIGEAGPGYISPAAIKRAARLLEQHGFDNKNADVMLGRFATEPKEWLHPDAPDTTHVTHEPLEIHGMARVAWSDHWIFANGRSITLPPGGGERVAALAASRRIDASELAAWRASPELSATLDWLWSAGLFDPGNGDPDLT